MHHGNRTGIVLNLYTFMEVEPCCRYKTGRIGVSVRSVKFGPDYMVYIISRILILKTTYTSSMPNEKAAATISYFFGDVKSLT